MGNFTWSFKHECGAYLNYPEGVPDCFLGTIYKDLLCVRCGQEVNPFKMEKVKIEILSDAKWYNPFTWLKSKVVEIK